MTSLILHNVGAQGAMAAGSSAVLGGCLVWLMLSSRPLSPRPAVMRWMLEFRVGWWILCLRLAHLGNYLRRERARAWMLYVCHSSFDVFNRLGLTLAVRLLQFFTKLVKLNDDLFGSHKTIYGGANPPNETS